MKLNQFGVWNTGPEDVSHWELFDSLEDAVTGSNPGSVIYKIEATKLGVFEVLTTIQKVDKKKSKAKK